MNRQVEELELQIKLCHKNNVVSQKLEAIPGIGPITASAIVATVRDAREFKSGKQLLLGISKRGDTYLRTLLIHGARAVVRLAESKAGCTN